ncbi:MAG: DUF1385 domain-containing protein [Oscillospiraceae bacterium]|jgi:uncharacterized protein YqhQ|nr:DUF1385 domain-containing protein [Oscillospiraceae bacterium]
MNKINSDKKSCPAKMTTIGGQALIEGIMMRGPERTAVSVRLANGEIDTDFFETKKISDKIKCLGWPVIRGVVNYVESMKFGYKALMHSAEKAGLEKSDESDSMRDSDTEQQNVPEPDEKSSPLFTVLMAVSSVIGVAIAVFLFMALPTFAFNFLETRFAPIAPFKVFVEGTIKIALFIAYLAAVTLMKDIKRVFMYHGAEHKAIFCYEYAEELTTENVMKQKRFHPRCGTSFLIIMLLVAIVFEGALIMIFPVLKTYNILWILLKIALILPICGCGYELIKICGRHYNLFTRIISAPGLWVQRLTTKEPDEKMVEVAITALKAVIPENPEVDKW